MKTTLIVILALLLMLMMLIAITAPQVMYASIHIHLTVNKLKVWKSPSLRGRTLSVIWFPDETKITVVRAEVVDEAVKDVENLELRVLLKGMLDSEPAKRPSSEEVVIELLKLLRRFGQV